MDIMDCRAVLQQTDSQMVPTSHEVVQMDPVHQPAVSESASPHNFNAVQARNVAFCLYRTVLCTCTRLAVFHRTAGYISLRLPCRS